ncbi:SMP-30/gluconolactonase/LRE family protein [Streptomyces sp. SID3343]|uniref:SMP-30/gluconolactonase/LRE family protein n=1 Tax=Streptomyces sp. SID3343 TaxID=2690260 RepID=UPI00136FD637|nr:SMP-30/gluconolactonase/LRE family protein [Streptomyces sp. SID3343]MYW04706.1 SMP-30/gluconolactonase/LRE family protein [Streptomyces sp. SID3343]
MTKNKRLLAFAAAFSMTLVIGGSATTTAAGTTDGQSADSAADRGRGTSGPREVRATSIAQVAPLDPPTPFGQVTVLEGPAFGPDGRLYFVDLTAPAGQPKILRFDPRTKTTRPVYTDATSGFSSLQFSPVDGKIYVTDFHNGRIARLDADGTGFTTVFSGTVAGRPMVPDDIAFDTSGAMYVADYQGSPWNRIGRVVRLDADGGNPIVLQDGLSAPNGISFTPDFSGLWVSEYSLGHEDHFTLAPDHKSVVESRVAMTSDIGIHGFDSNSVDAAGNVYQVVIGSANILVWNKSGERIGTIVVPNRSRETQLVSNVVIKPGTTQGYITVGGDTGGFIYEFRAFAQGIPQSNGGGA